MTVLVDVAVTDAQLERIQSAAVVVWLPSWMRYTVRPEPATVIFGRFNRGLFERAGELCWVWREPSSLRMNRAGRPLESIIDKRKGNGHQRLREIVGHLLLGRDSMGSSFWERGMAADISPNL